MSLPESNEYLDRLAKVAAIQALGIAPYAAWFPRRQRIVDLVLETHRELDALIPTTPESTMQPAFTDAVVTAGRVMLLRDHGKISFAKLRDQTGEIQLLFHKTYSQLVTIDPAQKDPVVTTPALEGKEMSSYDFLKKYIDVGDFVGVIGDLFYTKKNELTIFVHQFVFLSKALRPMGEKWHGVTNTEVLYRQRYIDSTMHPETLQRFLLRSTFLKVIRDFYHLHGFVEVETPILWFAASGAAAKPFITKHNELDTEMYLRISPETSLKKMTAGMFDRVFEVAKDFRNEWSDPSHHQEFTMIEHYASYWTYEDNMRFTEEMFTYIFEQIPQLRPVVQVVSKTGETHEVDFTPPWPRIDYIAQIKQDSGIDVSIYGPEDEETLRALIREKWFMREGMEVQGTATLIDYLYKKVTRPHIIGPAFIYNYPKAMQPLARPNDHHPAIVEQWQLLVNGWEVIKAYSELVNPVIQKANFIEQQAASDQGDEETTSSDDAFLLAMEYGMPPQSGRGMWIDRIFSLLTGCQNIRDVIYDPIMAPQHTHEEADAHEQEASENTL